MNNAVESDIPYFIYEAANYIGVYPSIQHTEPQKLIKLSEQFLQKGGEESGWMSEVLAGFCLLYGFLDKSKAFLKGQTDLKDNLTKGVRVSLLDLVNLVAVNDQKGIQAFMNLLTKLKKETKARAEIAYLDSLKEIAKHF